MNDFECHIDLRKGDVSSLALTSALNDYRASLRAAITMENGTSEQYEQATAHEEECFWKAVEAYCAIKRAAAVERLNFALRS